MTVLIPLISILLDLFHMYKNAAAKIELPNRQNYAAQA